jgi:hypothetical protein
MMSCLSRELETDQALIDKLERESCPAHLDRDDATACATHRVVRKPYRQSARMGYAIGTICNVSHIDELYAHIVVVDLRS